MQIKTSDGNYDVASKNLANTALGFGVAGLATSLLGGASSLMGINGMGRNATPDERPVTKTELDMAMQLQEKNLEIAKRDSTIALKESEAYTDKKLVEVYANLETQNNRQNDKIEQIRREQESVNAQQMAYNAAANANIDVLKSQVAALSGVTKVYIPSSNVCQSGCGCGCQQGV